MAEPEPGLVDLIVDVGGTPKKEIGADLFVDVSQDPPLDPRTAALLARSPYHPEDRNALLQAADAKDEKDEPEDDRPPSRKHPEYLRSIDIYGGDYEDALYEGGEPFDYEDVVMDPGRYFSLPDED